MELAETTRFRSLLTPHSAWTIVQAVPIFPYSFKSFRPNTLGRRYASPPAASFEDGS
jgi:hypothetical protein